MLDTEALRNQAFQFLPQQPEFCKSVLLLISELENSRFNTARQEELLEDDAKIIKGLANDFRKLEQVVIAARHYADGDIDKEKFEETWEQFVASIRKVAVVT